MKLLYKPRLIKEPLTGLTWVAHTRGEAMVATYPTLFVLMAFGLGYFAGSVL